MVSKRFIKNTLLGAAVAGAVGGIGYLGKTQTELVDRKYKRSKEYYDVTYQWVLNKQNQKTPDNFFRDEDIKSIAIYGMGSLGELFYNELKDRDIVEVKYFIDQMADLYSYGLDNIPVRDCESMMQEGTVDAVIVTPVHIFDDIKNNLQEQGYHGKIFSLRDVMEQMA